MSARTPLSIFAERRPFGGETRAERSARITAAVTRFFSDFGVPVIEVLASGILVSLAVQLARPAETFSLAPGFYRFLSGHASETEWAAIAGAIGTLPIVALAVNSMSLRWAALILEVFFFATWTFDAYRAAPLGVSWIFPGWVFLGCALGSFRVASGALREVRRHAMSVRETAGVRLFIIRARWRKRGSSKK